jgi:hypothetical protein
VDIKAGIRWLRGGERIGALLADDQINFAVHEPSLKEP